MNQKWRVLKSDTNMKTASLQLRFLHITFKMFLLSIEHFLNKNTLLITASNQ